MQTRPPDLSTLQARLSSAGLPSRPTARSFGEFGAFVALSVTFMALALSASIPWLIRALSAVGAAWFWTAAAMCGHDASHGTACRTQGQNHLLGRLAFTLVGGVSWPYWVLKHGKHHAHPNVSGRDPDIEHGVFAYSAPQHQRQPGAVQRLQRALNAHAFWILGALFVSWEVRVSSIRYLWQTRAPLREWIWMAGHFALVFGLPLALLPASAVLWMHLVGGTLSGAFLVMILAPGHLADPLVSRTSDPVVLQVAVSRNFRTLPGLRACLNGLHLQIEHHLAPNLNHFDLEAAAPLIKSFVEERGLSYRETGWGRALADVHRHLRRAWRTAELDLSGTEVPAGQHQAARRRAHAPRQAPAHLAERAAPASAPLTAPRRW